MHHFPAAQATGILMPSFHSGGHTVALSIRGTLAGVEVVTMDIRGISDFPKRVFTSVFIYSWSHFVQSSNSSGK